MNVKNKTKEEDIWPSLNIGDVAFFKTKISQDKINKFVILSGDKNPLHFDKKVARELGFKKPIAHGMLLALYFSTLVGEHFLKDHNLYLSQNINFVKPVLIGETVVIRGRVKNKIKSLRILEIETVVINSEGDEVVKGMARVQYI